MSDTKGSRLKRIAAGTLCFMLLLGTFSGAHAAVIEYTVTASKVNLRKQPNTSSGIAAVIRKGDALTLLSAEENGWLYVRSENGTSGYVSTEYAELISIEGTGAQAVVLPEKLNVRASTSTSSRILVVPRRGSVLDVHGIKDGWLNVSYKNQTGYVLPEYVELVPGVEPQPTAVIPANTPVPTYAPTAPVYVPTAAPTSAPAVNNVLQLGDRGEEVRQLQQGLITLGYLTGTADGIFGNGTQSAVKAFQLVKGLAATGIVDSATRIMLNATLSAASTAVPTTAPTITPTQAPVTVLKRGDRGDGVRELQIKLIALGYLSGSADGIFGSGTENAVKAFQRDHQLDDSGKADAALLAALDAAFATPVPTTAPTPVPTTPPTPAPTSVPTSLVLKKGDRGEDVRQLQLKLIALGYLSGEADGIYGSDTKDAVKAFQRNEGLDDDGVAGSQTLNALATAGGVPANPSQPDVNVPITSKLLKLGSSGEDVTTLQQQLIKLGYLSGSPTGYYGTDTRDAVKAFQRDKNLTVDGMAGTSTISALAEAVGNTASNPTGATLLKYGDSGEAVKILQTRLKELGYFNGTIGGNFGTLTRDAVAAFQSAVGLTNDGMAGEDTLNRLFADDAPKQESTTLRYGDTGDAVRELQTRLKELGYLTGAIDGQFGSGTQGAVMAFQSAAGLSADGVAGPLTLDILFSDTAPEATIPGGSADSTLSPIAPSIISTAKKYLGCKYVYACEDPPYFDCSGLTQYVFKQYGYSLLRTAQQQGYNDKYQKLNVTQLKMGDLVFFNTNLTDADMCDHTGIYIGDGDFIHASSSAGKIIISNLNSGYYSQRFSWGRRILDQ